jgi:hypothetical protein
MKHIPAAVIVLSMWVCGCSSSPKSKGVDEGAADRLGPNAVYVLSNPTRVEGWNFRRPDGSTSTDPQIRQLKTSVGQELGKVLLDADTYKEPARGGGFERAVGYRVWRGDQNVELYLSFANDQLYVKYPGYGGQAVSASTGFTHARDQLLDVARKAFPDYRAPEGPAKKRK